jgi:hypothetical protein
LWILLAALVFATPIGLLAPGTAWGEWGSNQFTRLGLSFVPQGLKQLEGLWGAPLAGYNLASLGNANLGYIISAIAGIVVISVITWLLVTAFSATNPKDQPVQTDPRSKKT